MPSLKTVERQIGNLEDFDVTIRHRDGRDARGDRQGLPGYAYERQAKGSMTVSKWRKHRFNQYYSGWQVDVLNADGDAVPGHTKLLKVRESYAE